MCCARRGARWPTSSDSSPSPRLQELERAILQHDPELAGPRPPGAGDRVPRPAALDHGRAARRRGVRRPPRARRTRSPPRSGRELLADRCSSKTPAVWARPRAGLNERREALRARRRRGALGLLHLRRCRCRHRAPGAAAGHRSPAGRGAAPACSAMRTCRTILARGALRRRRSSSARPADGPVLVAFSGAEHDWAAIELGAWLARRAATSLVLAGSAGDGSGRDASRLLRQRIARRSSAPSASRPSRCSWRPSRARSPPRPPAWVSSWSASRTAGSRKASGRRARRSCAREDGATLLGAPRPAPGRPRARGARDPLHLDDPAARRSELSAPAGAVSRAGSPPSRLGDELRAEQAAQRLRRLRGSASTGWNDGAPGFVPVEAARASPVRRPGDWHRDAPAPSASRAGSEASSLRAAGRAPLRGRRPVALERLQQRLDRGVVRSTMRLLARPAGQPRGTRLRMPCGTPCSRAGDGSGTPASRADDTAQLGPQRRVVGAPVTA